MAKSDRIRIIKELQKRRGTYVISYVTSTRENLEVQMAMDSIRKIYEHLQSIDRPPKTYDVDLFLHSNGGDGIVPWRLVTLIREYAKNFSVLVPFKAFSAATLTALGANCIVMHPMAMLGPTDPTVTNPFNPANPNGQLVGISVEDVTAYISLIKEDVGIQHEDELVQAFNKLPEKIHPLALGNVKRSLSQSRMMAKKLLCLHMDSGTDEHKINEIVDNITSKLFYHGHPINRHEALNQIGVATVKFPPKQVEKFMWQLYLEYEKELKNDEPFQTAMEFVSQFPNLNPGESAITPRATAKLAYVESAQRTDCASWDYMISGQKQPNGITQVTPITCRQGWTKE